MNNNIKNNQTDDENEIKKFSEMASEWWNPKGKFAPLHHFNPVRLEYFVNQIKKHFSIAPDKQFPFKNLSILDVGCGGGLISEPMARLGGKVTGIDASLNNINVAKFHAKEMNLEINYLDVTPEKMTKSYDVILCLEIIEHVADVDFFIKSCEKLLKKNGIIIFSTLNRTIKSFLLAIISNKVVSHSSVLIALPFECNLDSLTFDFTGLNFRLFTTMSDEDLVVRVIRVFDSVSSPFICCLRVLLNGRIDDGLGRDRANFIH